MAERPSYRTCEAISAQCPVQATTYGYFPNLPGNAFFAAWFGILLILALMFGFRSRTWTYTLALGIGAVMECLGYVGRIMMNKNPWDSGAFQMQICCLVLAPSFIAASIYLTLKHLVLYLGPEHSLIKPRLYPWIFVGCDLLSIVIQAGGGGIAAAAGRTDRKLLNVGNNLIVTGIAFQVATMTCCGLLAAIFFFRFHKSTNAARASQVSTEVKSEYAEISNDPNKKRNLRIFMVAIAIAYITVLIRCIYRLPEMAGGWGNPLMQNEKEFLILDGAMLAIATFALTVIHPLFFFSKMCRNRRAEVQQDSSS